MVGGVLGVFQPISPDISQNIRLAHQDQRADEDAVFWGDALHPQAAGAPDQVEQQGLGAVLQMVAGGDGAGVPRPGGLLQKVPPQVPGGLLQAQAVRPCIGQGVPRPAEQRDVQRITQPLAQGPLGPGAFGPQPMGKVGGGHGDAPLRRPGGQQMGHAHRIGAAGQSAQHPVARPQQSEAGKGVSFHGGCPGAGRR